MADGGWRMADGEEIGKAADGDGRHEDVEAVEAASGLFLISI
jgi:hypothetical protein